MLAQAVKQLPKGSYVAYSAEEIAAKEAQIAEDFLRNYLGIGATEVVMLIVLSGAIEHAVGLGRAIEDHPEGNELTIIRDTIQVQRTRNTTSLSEPPKIVRYPFEILKNRHVFIVEDILEEGFTLGEIIREIRKDQPAFIRISPIIQRKNGQKVDLEHFMLGKPFLFDSLDWAFGYGMDNLGKLRGLPQIHAIKTNSTD